MIPTPFVLSLVAFWLWAAAATTAAANLDSPIVVATNGSIRLTLPLADNTRSPVTLTFGLPNTAPLRRWRENGLLCTLWKSNSVEYTQTVLLSHIQAPPPANSNAVLVVDVRGLNTDGEYREASAEFSVRSSQGLLPLELSRGVVWRVANDGAKSRLAVLEVPESGIRRAQGQSILFYGAMPPSIDGSLQIKLPLDQVQWEQAVDLLHDLDIRARSPHKAGRSAPPSAHSLCFEEEMSTSSQHP